MSGKGRTPSEESGKGVHPGRRVATMCLLNSTDPGHPRASFPLTSDGPLPSGPQCSDFARPSVARHGVGPGTLSTSARSISFFSSDVGIRRRPNVRRFCCVGRPLTRGAS